MWELPFVPNDLLRLNMISSQRTWEWWDVRRCWVYFNSGASCFSLSFSSLPTHSSIEVFSEILCCYENIENICKKKLKCPTLHNIFLGLKSILFNFQFFSLLNYCNSCVDFRFHESQFFLIVSSNFKSFSHFTFMHFFPIIWLLNCCFFTHMKHKKYEI